MRKHTWWVLTCLLSVLCCQKPQCPHLCSNRPPYPHQFLATPGVGRQLGQASACVSQGLRGRQEIDPLNFCALGACIPRLGAWDVKDVSRDPLPRHCSCFLF